MPDQRLRPRPSFLPGRLRGSAARVLLAALPATVLGATLAQAADGAGLYAQNCAVCHQADATGLAGQYPPLKNRVDKIAATPEGRAYLAEVLTHGMAGPIDAAGATYVGFMPAFKQLKDDEIAAILSWVSSQGTTKPAPELAAADIAAGRAKTLNAAAVAKDRATLAAQHPLP